MTHSTWDKSLETGNEMIDKQHRKLIGLVDELDEVKFKTHADALFLLDRMTEFTVAHFLSEEILMEEVRYPPKLTKEMVEQHREFKSYIRLRTLEFRQGAFDIASFQSFVGHFLKVHEFGTDRKLANWIRQRDAV